MLEWWSVVVGVVGLLSCCLWFAFKYFSEQNRASVLLYDRAYQTELNARLKERLDRLTSDIRPPTSVVLKFEPLKDDVLKNYLAQGPEASVWKAVEEIARRLLAEYQSLEYTTQEEKASAIDHMNAVQDLLREMYTWHNAFLKDQAKG